MLKRTLKIGILLLALAGITLVYLGHRLRSGPDLPSGAVELAGLQEPVEVLYDSMGVPHIFAASMEDLFFAQGYVHAKDRLWQMEMFRRVLQGRLSEIFGARTLETDRFLRTMGMEKAAREGMPPPGTAIHHQMEAYSAGVNAAIRGWEGFLPPEFVLLRLHPEPWAPFLVQGIEKIMAWDLSDYQTGLNLAAAREILGDSALAPLMPRYPEWGVTIVEGWPEVDGEKEAPAGAAAGQEDEEPSPEPGPGTDSSVSTDAPWTSRDPPLPPPVPWDLLAQARLAEDAVRVLELGSVVRASNAWVVGGARSASGKPLMANDMHLALNAPNIWYLVGLHAPGYDVVGMSIPGAPGVVAGHTPAVAWGFTNAMVDDSDFFVERVNPDDPGQYLTPQGWASFETREEVIQVKGADPVTLTVRSTRHGPVITPVEDRAGDQILAFQWVAHSPANTFPALLGMGQARTVEAFLLAAREFHNPHQNLVFADTAGDWGYWMGGRVPLRASGRPPHLPVPGWTGEHDWVGWVPFEEKPHVLAPERGYVVTANNAQGRDEASRRVTDQGWFGPYRAQRITELLEARERHDAESMLAIQMDVTSAFVDRNLAHAVRAFREAGLGDLATRLESWDRRATLESTEATLFHAWWEALHRGYRERYYAGERGHFPDRITEAALAEGSWSPASESGKAGPDSGSPLSLPAIPGELPLEAARAAAHFAHMPWGEAHRLTLDHPMAAVPVLGRLLKFGRSGIPRAGGPYSVNVGPFSGSRPPFPSGYGPSQRHVVDMADPDGSGGFILPGGQSGYPANPHSFDQLDLWREGRLWLLPLDRREVEGRAVATFRLRPGPSP